ncbi:MAG: MGMT family protein [Halioglobus sp.]|jgi:methylated-DNA-protein-cysteine methyltransferase-like protein
MPSSPDIDQRIWQVVARIPPGRVATYGEVARQAGLPGAARRVGRALRALPAGTRLPWHRVINARGRVSLPEGGAGHRIQRERLQSEGIAFRANGAIDLRRFGWVPGLGGPVK